MDKSIKINLAGVVFNIDQDAYYMLRDYLQSINIHFQNLAGGNETIDDIEARIAEIFQSRKSLSAVISREDVEEVISIIGRPEDFEPDEMTSGTGRSDHYNKRLYRDPDERIISGVSGGLASYFNVDPILIRIIFIITALFYGVGFFVYVALWISLPLARSDAQKMELYGSNVPPGKGPEPPAKFITKPSHRKKPGSGSSVSDGLNEIFDAIGKVFFIFLRIILIIIGVSFVIAGFATMVVFIMTFFFHYPGYLFDISSNPGIFYLPDFLDFLVSPGLTPWVMLLTTIIVMLPLIAMVYWGVKMIFWFRAHDRVISLIALVVWIMALSILGVILFSQGISFGESGTKTDMVYMDSHPDTIYIKSGGKIADLNYDEMLSLPDDSYTLYLNLTDNLLYGKPDLRIRNSDDNDVKLEINRYSRGRTKREAVEKAGSFIYDSRISGNVIYLDQYYTFPPGSRWTGSYVNVYIFIPEGTIIWFDEDAENLFGDYIGHGTYSWELGGKFWEWTEDGLERSHERNRQ
jgi:phage shock protein PspC (stress-responsive transcriptional regulator)